MSSVACGQAPAPCLRVLKIQDLARVPRNDFNRAMEKLSAASLKQLGHLVFNNCGVLGTDLLKMLLQR